MKRLFCILFAFASITIWAADSKLTGRVIGSSPSVDYSNSSYPATTTRNTPSDAFDGNMSTFYASYDRSYTFCGLDLGQPYIITKVGWSPRNDGNGPKRTQLALFEGANHPDFSDALPLYLTDEVGTIGVMSYANVTCSKGFRYVRYVGPNNSRCNVAEVEFYGHPGVGNETALYRPTNLPCVIIRTENAREPLDKINELNGFVTILGEDGSILTDTATTRCRGNASLQFEKKPYRIKFQSKHSVLGSPAKAKKWCLINNYGDKTLMRNLVAYEYARRLGMTYVPFCQPVDVILNGEYKGCYQLADQLEIKKGRIDIDEMTPRDNNGLAVTGGYHLEMDGYANEEPPQGRFYSSPYNMGITIKEPDSDSITNQQKAYIQSHFNLMANAVSTNGNWHAYLDSKSFIQHFLVGELTGNTDTYWSMHMYKRRGNDTIFCGPEWDFDIAFDNDYRHYPTCNKSNYVYYYAGTNRSFVDKIFQNQQAISERQYIWSDARLNRHLTQDEINAYIDDMADYLNESQRLNFIRWPILSQNVHMNPRNAGSYAGEVTFLKEYVSNRFRWMDNKIGLIYVPNAIDETEAIEGRYLRIYDLRGFLLYEGCEMPHLPQGFYIINQGEHTYKIYLRD